ncbi:hypothetical protein HRbin12_00953 [bacterium HR12]|nr:hypothetical protein HRbin12_00953 [bacterium HR12]
MGPSGGSERLGRGIPALGALAAVLLVWFLLPYALGRFAFPLGPDAPVYLWWIRLAGREGLSAVGHRPGVPALALALRGTLGISEVQVVAALEGALGVATGLAAAALVRLGGDRAPALAWWLAGLLAGAFAVHLAAGYLANLAFAAAFLAVGALLVEGSRRGALGAAVVLGAGGLAHPLFLLVGLAVLAVAAALAWGRDRDEAMRTASIGLLGGALAGVGLLAMLGGPRPPEVDTSKDGFLRRAGLEAELRRAYLDRFVHRAARYVPWASVPLAVGGVGAVGGALARFLLAWGLVTVGGVGMGLATGVGPPDRFVTFAFVLPILAALGLERLRRALAPRPALAAVAPAGLAVAMLAGAWIAWDRQEPFVSELELARATTAARFVAAAAPGTPLVFHVDQEGPAVTFLATRAANVIRAAVPPDRIRDVVILVPPPRGEADAVRRALTRVTRADAERASAAAGGRRLDVLLAPFDRPDAARAGPPWRRVAPGVFLAGDVPERPVAAPDPLRPSSPAGIAWATVATLVLLALAGLGWARLLVPDRTAALALAPALGAAAMLLSAVLLERLGAPLDGGALGGALASALGGGSGYLAGALGRRRIAERGP